jgi:hypothetical protein
MPRSRKRAFVLGVALSVASSGCAIDLDLKSSPKSAGSGDPVTFDVKMTNVSQCPVGNAGTLLFPFVPAEELIEELVDDEVSADLLREAVEALCTGGDLDVPPMEGVDCDIIAGELICTIADPLVRSSSGTQEAVAFESTSGADRVKCQRTGSTITCRIPRSMMEAAQASSTTSAAANAPLTCVKMGGFAACGPNTLAPGEMARGKVKFRVDQPGVLRNFGFAFATDSGGVCKTGTAQTPCNESSDCPGACGNGICSGGSNDGFGCDNDGECDGGECVDCGVEMEEALLGLACTTTVVGGVQAPTMSSWGLAASVFALAGIAAWGLYRARRRFL